MLLEVMDSMFRPFKFHKVFYWSYNCECDCRASCECDCRAVTVAAVMLPQSPLQTALLTPLPLLPLADVYTLVMPNSVFIYWGQVCF